MSKITISTELKEACPSIRISSIACSVSNTKTDEDLWKLIQRRCDDIASVLVTEEIKNNPAIAAARLAYKACGKDPARYRLSAEALLRRVVSGKGIYQINTVVDLLNLVSVSTGFSIGGYDADKITGNITMGIGKNAEPYQGLGRGELNIEGMPVFRDNGGAFGTSTSDSERTGVELTIQRFLMLIVTYGGNDGLQEATDMAVALLEQYASATNFEIKQIE